MHLCVSKFLFEKNLHEMDYKPSYQFLRIRHCTGVLYLQNDDLDIPVSQALKLENHNPSTLPGLCVFLPLYASETEGSRL